MTIKVPKSQVDGTNFDQRVKDHVIALAAHAAHMACVDAEKNKPAAERTYEPYPAPTEHPLVDAAVRRVDGGGFQIDYDVEDDGPTPEETFARKKIELQGAVGAAETAAKGAVMPAGKTRLHGIRVADASAKKAKERSADDQAVLDLEANVSKRLDAINRHGAMMHAEIEDLTADTIDGWTMKEFPR